MPTDIDRLHRVAGGGISGRGCGKTFSRVHALASIIELGEATRVIFFIARQRDISYLMPMIEVVFQERGVPFEFSPQWLRLRSANVIVQFAPLDSPELEERYLRGIGDHFEIEDLD